jgi:hypothetical protein
MHPSWNNSASGSWLRAAYWRLTMPTSPRLALMNRWRACSPWSSRARSSCSVASAKPAPETLASRASRPASIARCSSIISARVSGCLVDTSSRGAVMPDTVQQVLPLATPRRSKSVDNWASPAPVEIATTGPGHRLKKRTGWCRYPSHGASVFGANAAGVQRLAPRLEHDQLGEHLVVFVLLLNRVRTLQFGFQCRDRPHHREQLKSG